MLRKPSLVVFVLLPLTAHAADDPAFSGPQVGGKLASFEVRGVYDDQKGKIINPSQAPDGRPVALIFVHKVT